MAPLTVDVKRYAEEEREGPQERPAAGGGDHPARALRRHRRDHAEALRIALPARPGAMGVRSSDTEIDTEPDLGAPHTKRGLRQILCAGQVVGENLSMSGAGDLPRAARFCAHVLEVEPPCCFWPMARRIASAG